MITDGCWSSIPICLLLELRPWLVELLPWHWGDAVSTFLRSLRLEGSSFSSINDKNRLRALVEPPGMRSPGLVWYNECRICKKYMTRAIKQALPQIRKRPQKLLRWSWFDSISVLSELQRVCKSHLSWILWRSPFSERARIAVDKSTASGESRGNAYQERENTSEKKE